MNKQPKGTRFSTRHGYRIPEPEISLREDAPKELRDAIPQIAADVGMGPTPMRQVVCLVLQKRPDPTNWTDYPNVSDEVYYLISGCPWFKVYDIAEKVFESLASPWDMKRAQRFEEQLNEVFVENGIGWQMTDGLIMYRGSETFMKTTKQVGEILEENDHVSSAREIREALQDISRRPEPDVTGAIQHVMAALECTAREVSGKPKRTLGSLIRHLNLPQPLDTAVEKIWGYASGRARHIQEGQSVSNEEAELVVAFACSLCTFLAKRGANSQIDMP